MHVHVNDRFVVTDPTELPLGDIEYFRALAKNSGEAITKELIASAPDAVDKENAHIKAALEAEDSGALKAAAHALKGACYSMQAKRLAHYARELEMSANDIQNARDKSEELFAVAELTIAWWLEILDKKSYLPE
ncbi:Hpt domain-containing protein [Sneathiella limimaris]|uniref:Hpt domain-containing protein n=1 Tax=Sneathiella limimaris TaxID=1964213 RepID=UPI00146A7F3E|nr:Hpt domain-containing protein [Sneathiella limimaris]